MMKVLKLTLSKKPFEVMVTGEKNIEYRSASNWMISRLYDRNGKEKKYDFVHFVNGYGLDRPNFYCRYLGFREIGNSKIVHKYSNGLVVDEGVMDVELAILLGEIVDIDQDDLRSHFEN